jgi:tetratricopeptide (TPR) repeat protein
MGLNIDQQLRTAKAQIKAGRADEARVTLLQALDVYPDNVRLLGGLADAQKLLTGLPPQGFGMPHFQHFMKVKAQSGLGLAVEEIAAAVKLNPKHPWPKSILGGALIEAGMLPAAILQLRAALKLDPKFKEASLNLANALGMAGETVQSLAVLDAALTHHPDFLPALRMKGHALMHLKQGEAAAKVLDHYLSIKPGDVEAKVDLGVALNYFDNERAAAVLSEVFTANPSHLRAMSNLGNAYLALGDLPEAIALLEEHLRRVPKSGISFFNLGRARDFLPGDPLIAQMQALEGDTSLDEEETIALHFGLAKALEDIGEVDESFRHLKTGNDMRMALAKYDLSHDATVFADLRPELATATDLCSGHDAVWHDLDGADPVQPPACDGRWRIGNPARVGEY